MINDNCFFEGNGNVSAVDVRSISNFFHYLTAIVNNKYCLGSRIIRACYKLLEMCNLHGIAKTIVYFLNFTLNINHNDVLSGWNDTALIFDNVNTLLSDLVRAVDSTNTI